MSRRANVQPQQSLVVPALGLGAVGAVFSAVFGFGFGVVLLAAVLVAGWTAVPPVFTGKKDVNGFPTPNGPGELSGMLRYRFWCDVRWRVLVPNEDWFKLWPILFCHVGGLVVGGLGLLLPVNPDAPSWLVWVNFGVVVVLVWQVDGSWRRFAAERDPSPGVGLFVLGEVWGGLSRVGRVLNVVGLGLLGSVVGVGWWLFVPVATSGVVPGQWAGLLGGVCAGLGVVGLVLWQVCRAPGLGVWRELVETRSLWDQRWLPVGLKHSAPVLVSHELVGGLVVDVFDAPPELGAAGFTNDSLVGKLKLVFGAGFDVWVLGVEQVDGQGQPLAGVFDPIRFRVVYVKSDEVPDISAPGTDVEVAGLLVDCAMAQASDEAGYARYYAANIQPLTGEDSPGVVWGMGVGNVMGVGLRDFRDNLMGAVGGVLGVEVLCDHREGNVFVGALGAVEDADFAVPIGGDGPVQLFTDLVRDDEWRGRWLSILKNTVNAPKPELSLWETTEVVVRGGGRVELTQLPFLVLQGEDLNGYLTADVERKLKTALEGAPFVSCVGWVPGGPKERAGERHPMAFSVRWAHGLLPAGPHQLPPQPVGSVGGLWVLADMVNRAFTASRLAARPEVVSVRCLTKPESPLHVWAVGLRLYGGVTLSDVRGAAEKIRLSMGSDWLRVVEGEDGCRLFVGGLPGRVVLGSRRDEQVLAGLDWEWFFDSAKVRGLNGLLPKLVDSSVLPANELVQSLVFDLPPGLSVADVRGSVEKLKVAAGKLFVEVRTEGLGPGKVRLLVSELDPLPERVGFDFEVVDGLEGLQVAFATGVEGEPVVFDPGESPHAFLGGVTGAGKSVLAQNFLFGMGVKGAHLFVIDAVKGGADFVFAKDHTVAFATTVLEAVQVMNYVYGQVVERKNLNAEYGVGSYMDLPEGVRPAPIVVFVDEFTSLMQASAVPKASGDSELDVERELLVAENEAKLQVGMLAGKLAREARSAGVTLLLATQKMKADMLDSIPGAGDLKTNLARVLLGRASHGERASAFRDPEGLPRLQGEIPKGRGIWEPLSSSGVVVQVWYESQEVLREELFARREPLGEGERLVFEDAALVGGAADVATVGGGLVDDGGGVLVVDEGLFDDLGDVEVEQGLGDGFGAEWLISDEGAGVVVGGGVVDVSVVDVVLHESHVVVVDAEVLDADGVLGVLGRAGFGVVVFGEPPSGVLPEGVVVGVLPGVGFGGGEFGFERLDVLVGWLETNSWVRSLVWVDGGLGGVDGLGVGLGEVVADVLTGLGVDVGVVVPAGGGLSEFQLGLLGSVGGQDGPILGQVDGLLGAGSSSLGLVDELGVVSVQGADSEGLVEPGGVVGDVEVVGELGDQGGWVKPQRWVPGGGEVRPELLDGW